MAGRIVVFGATGYTGRLVVAQLVSEGVRPVVAARRPEVLASLAEEHGGLETAVADAGDPSSVRALVERGDVLVTTVGPFSRHGRPAVDAAVDAGAHYVDSTGEAGFVREVVLWDGPRAERSGSALLTAGGYDYVPGHVAAALAVEAAGDGEVRVIEVTYSGLGVAISSGTRASAVSMLTESTHRLVGGRLVERPMGRDVRGACILTGGSEPLVLPRVWPHLREVSVWLEVGPPARAAQVASFVAPALVKVPWVRGRLERLGDVSGEGPSAEERARSGTDVVAVATDGDGREVGRGRVTGPNPYDVTAITMAALARRLAAPPDGAVRPGAVGPLDLFEGIAAAEVAAALGLTVG